MLKISIAFILNILIFNLNTFSQKYFTKEIISNLNSVNESVINTKNELISYTLTKNEGINKTYELHLTDYNSKNDRIILKSTTRISNIYFINDIIYFIWKNEKKSKFYQIYSININDTISNLFYNNSTDINRFKFSEDKNFIAFTCVDGITEVEKNNIENKRDWIVNDGIESFNRLHLLNVSTKEKKILFNQNLNVYNFNWNKNNSIVFQATTKTNADFGLMYKQFYSININDSVPKLLFSNKGKLGDFDISPDGNKLIYCGADEISDPLAQSLFEYDIINNGTIKITNNSPYSITSVKFLDNDNLVFSAISNVNSFLYSLNLKNYQTKQITNNSIVFNSFNIDVKTKNYCLVADSPNNEREVYFGILNKKEPTKITNSNTILDSIVFSKQEVISWKSNDSLEIHGILTYPVNYDKTKKYPLILFLHGGPEGVSFNGWTSTSLYPIQLLGANNYFVLEVNYRGSEGKGVAFAKANHKDLGGKDFEDLLSGISFLSKKNYIDKNKVGIAGFSYGGYLAALAATKYTKYFKAAMVGAGISDWISFLYTTDITDEMSIVHWNMDCFSNYGLLLERSPLSYTKDSETPLLIVHGENDLRVPISQGTELYKSLNAFGKKVEMVEYKRQGHGINEYEAKVDYMQRLLIFFNKNLK